jgi:hypothetical protein
LRKEEEKVEVVTSVMRATAEAAVREEANREEFERRMMREAAERAANLRKFEKPKKRM